MSRIAQSAFPHPEYSRTVLQPAYEDARRHLFEAMLAAHEAHAVMLAECRIIPAADAVAICAAVDRIRLQGVAALGYLPGIEDLFFRVEAAVIQVAGADAGGNLQLARSRNDLGQALMRMALRRRLLDLQEDLLDLIRALLDLAGSHTQSLMPGYTHTQPAQPVTFAHYLAGVITFLLQDLTRLRRAYANVNRSPLGAAAFTGTGFAIDRQRVGELLGFRQIIVSTHHCIGAGDHLTDSAFALQSLAVGLSRVTQDLLFLATRESGALHVADSFIQISSIMPQKRNPVVLEHLRARLSRGLGYAQTVVIQCHNIPYGDTQDIEDEIVPPLMAGLDTLQECLQLYTAVFSTLELNLEHLRARAGRDFATATELADLLVREVGLPFRQAHATVSRLVQEAVRAGIPGDGVTLAMLQEAARAVLGRELPVSPQQLQQSLSAQNFVEVRRGPGGVAPQATAALLAEQGRAANRDRDRLAAARRHLEQADLLRRRAVAGLA